MVNILMGVKDWQHLGLVPRWKYERNLVDLTSDLGSGNIVGERLYGVSKVYTVERTTVFSYLGWNKLISTRGPPGVDLLYLYSLVTQLSTFGRSSLDHGSFTSYLW